MTIKTIASSEAQKLIESNKAILIDVRESGEYKQEYIHGAINNPLSALNLSDIKDQAQNTKIIIQCLSGKRAAKACKQINESLKNIDAYVLEGGIEGWKKSNFKTIRSGHGVSIQRQVMMIAGLIVLLGSLSSIYVNPNLIAIPVFVGCGLFFAGISGWCGMAYLLNKMPWNR